MKRVLIVDDAIDLGRLLQDALKVTRPDTPITVVPSAEEALLEATRYQFDLLISDLRLPGMSGLDLVRKIRVRQPDIKVILITALMPEDRLVRQKDEVRPDIFIRKPISVGTFLEAVESLIGVETQELPHIAEPIMEADQPPVDPPPPAESVAVLPAAQESVPPSVESLPATALPPVSDADAEPVQEPSLGTLRELDTVVVSGPGEESVQKITGPLNKEVKEQLDSPAAPAVPEIDEVVVVEGIIQTQEENRTESVSTILTRVRVELGAKAVLLLNDHGQTVEETGALPDHIHKDQLVPAVMASISSGARVSRLFGRDFQGSVQAFHGKEFDLVFAPAGEFVLMILLQAGRSALRLPLAFEEALFAQADLVQSLSEIGVKPVVEMSSSAEQTAPGVTRLLHEDELPHEIGAPVNAAQEAGSDKLEDLLVRMTGYLQRDDAEDFWETASDNQTKDVDSPDMLSYDQAQKLGLVKPDEEES